MSTRSASLAALVLVTVLAVPAAATAPPPPGADAQALWTHITQTAPYQQWGQWPDFAGLREGKSPHGEAVRVYVNPPALEAKGLPLPPGSLIVKEGYGADRRLGSLTVMYKIAGYNPRGGDWFWVKYDPHGQAGPAGTPKGCLGCHGASADNDYVVAHRYR